MWSPSLQEHEAAAAASSKSEALTRQLSQIQVRLYRPCPAGMVQAVLPQIVQPQIVQLNLAVDLQEQRS